MNKLILQLLIPLVLISCKGESQSKNWALDSNSTLEGTTYRSTENQSLVRILSIQELEKLAFRKIKTAERASHEDQLEFILSVLAIDVDEMTVDKKGATPILSGNGYSEEGEVNFAITYQDRNTNNVVLLVSLDKAFDTFKALDLLRADNFNLSSNKTSTNQVKANKPKQTPSTKLAEKKYPLPYGTKDKAGKVYFLTY